MTKRLTEEYNYSEMREQILAWSIAWEGHIGLYKAKRSRGHAFQYVPKISLDNTDILLLEHFVALVGYGHTGVHRWVNPSNRKVLYHWYLCSLKDCKRFCEEVLPYLPAKRRQAELIIEFCGIRMNPNVRKNVAMSKGETTWGLREEEIYQELKELNKRGE